MPALSASYAMAEAWESPGEKDVLRMGERLGAHAEHVRLPDGQKIEDICGSRRSLARSSSPSGPLRADPRSKPASIGHTCSRTGINCSIHQRRVQSRALY